MTALIQSAVLLLCGLQAVNAAIYPTRFDGVTWDDDNWRLTTTVLDQGHYQSRMSLANGYLGINVAAVGPFFEVDTSVAGDDINGWPLFDRRQTFATIAGFWDSQPTTNGTNFPWLEQYGGESVISGVPHWAGLVVELDGQVLDASVNASQISGFSSTLDIGAGMMTWQYTWTPADKPAIDVEYSMFVHKLHVNQAAVQLKLTASRDVDVTVVDVLDGDCALRTNFVDKQYENSSATIWSAVQPLGIDFVTAYIYSTMTADQSVNMSTRRQVTDSRFGGNQSSIAQAVDVCLTAGQTTVIEKYIGGASTDAFENPQTVAKQASASGAKQGFVSMLHSHIEEWESIMTDDSVDDFSLPDGNLPDDPNILELQITSVTNPFYLLQNVVGTNAIAAAGNNTKLSQHGISVCGLGSECYAGWVFWDMDVWMAPGLVVAHPQAGQQIANYRVSTYAQAKKNVATAYAGSQNQTQFTSDAAAYSWVSGRFGNCTAAGPCWDYEYHLNGDIGLQLFNYYVTTGDLETFKNEFFPIYNSIAALYSELLNYNATSKLYSLRNATDPDEYANHVDNPGYTMALIQTHLETANMFRSRLGLPTNETWATQAAAIDVPVNKEANIILEYQQMNGSVSVKQADVILVDDFLDYPNPYSLSDLDWYAGKQSANGPGMTYGVFSIVANEVSPSGCSAYTYDLEGSHPYIRGPWFQYSEQLLDNYEENGGTHPAYPFLTGMGGANRVTIFGYLGLRLLVDALNVDPNLPPQITNIDYRTFYWQGHAISAVSNATHTTLTRLPAALPNANATYATAAIPVTVGSTNTTHLLPANGTLSLLNRRIGTNATWSGNLAQCRPATSPQDTTPGQFALAAVDGAISTSWQPASASTLSWLLVELAAPGTPITSFRFDWAQAPPSFFTVLFSNASISSSSLPSSIASLPLSSAALQSGGLLNVTAKADVGISDPYVAARGDDIVAYVGNTTEARLPQPVWSARYAALGVWGLAGRTLLNGTGATVAEWGIIGA